MESHDDFMSVDVDVPLHQGHRLSEDVKARSDQVNVEHLVVSDDAEHSLVVVCGSLRVELDDDPRLGPWLNGPLELGEGEYIGFV